MKYLGPDGMSRELQGHLDYLERCAKRWEEEAGKASKPADREAAHEEAARVRRMATDLRAQAQKAERT